jgi:hypothetical protein
MSSPSDAPERGAILRRLQQEGFVRVAGAIHDVATGQVELLP